VREHENFDWALVVILTPLLSAIRLFTRPGRQLIDLSHEHDIHVGSGGNVGEGMDNDAHEEHVSLEASETDVTIIEEFQRVSVVDTLAHLIIKIVRLNSVELDLTSLFWVQANFSESQFDFLHVLELFPGLFSQLLCPLINELFGVLVLVELISFRSLIINGGWRSIGISP
jgi:hypothetical protein